jgi:hypothetical protein
MHLLLTMGREKDRRKFIRKLEDIPEIDFVFGGQDRR